MKDLSTFTLLIALQFAAFGWRINREINMGDKNSRTWLPITDLLNIASMIFLITVCILLPNIGLNYNKLMDFALTSGFILIIFHPINMAAHYRLFSKTGRAKYIAKNKDFPYITDQETFTTIITVLLLVFYTTISFQLNN